MDAQKQGFNEWAIVELMGHQRIAGRVSEQQIGGTSIVRVDVPEIDGFQPVTRFLGSSAIYAINPVDQETALLAAKEICTTPVNAWSARRMLEEEDAAEAKRKALAAPDHGDFYETDDQG